MSVRYKFDENGDVVQYFVNDTWKEGEYVAWYTVSPRDKNYGWIETSILIVNPRFSTNGTSIISDGSTNKAEPHFYWPLKELKSYEQEDPRFGKICPKWVKVADASNLEGMNFIIWYSKKFKYVNDSKKLSYFKVERILDIN